MTLAPKATAVVIACAVALGVTGAAAADTSQKVVTRATTGHVYEFVTSSGRTWASARTEAALRTHGARHGHLATITSGPEFVFVKKAFKSLINGCDAWLGGYQDPTAPDYSEPAGGWRWVTGEVWDYTAWASGEPNNSGGEEVLHTVSNGRWNDLSKNSTKSCYIVEYDHGA